MHVSTIMKKNLKTLKFNAYVSESAEVMRDNDISIIAIETNKGVIGGVITDRDIVTRLTAYRGDPNTTQVHEIMTEGVLYCYEDQNVREVLNEMIENQVHKFLVKNRQGSITGVITLRDLILALIK